MFTNSYSMELIDKCVHCGKPKGEHDTEYYYCHLRSYETFKSITVAAAEKNAVRNLELLIEAKECLEWIKFNPLVLTDPNDYNIMASRDELVNVVLNINKAIEDSTPKE